MKALGKSEELSICRIQKCPECGSSHLAEYYEGNGRVCMDCGLAIASKAAEQYSDKVHNSKHQKRAGSTASHTASIQGVDFSVTFANSEKIHEEDITQGQKARIFAKWQKLIKVSDATERNVALALLEITKIVCDLHLPKTILEKASATYKMAVQKRIIKGRSIRALSAGAVYVACRQCGSARTIDDVALASKINAKKVGRNYRLLVKQLNFLIPTTKPSQYLSQLSTRLPMQREATEIANNILNVADKGWLSSGRDPMGIAAATSYIASLLIGKKRTQREIAEIARITEATIRARCRELEKHLLFIIYL